MVIEERQEAVDWLLATYFCQRRDTTSNTNGGGLDATDDELLARAFDAANGDKLRRLWNGDTTDYPSASEADMALASLLAFWTGPDAMRLETLMRSSGLAREKWDKHRYADGQTYLKAVVSKALEGRREFYAPGQNGATSNGHAGVTVEADDTEGSEEEAPPAEVLTFPELAWRGVFGAYRQAFEGTSETPDVFHFASLWTAAAIRLQRRLSLFYGYPMHPNIYLLLFAHTGESKTTTLRQAADLFPGDGRIKKLSGVGSAEALADWLTQQEEAPRVGHVLLLEELASLLSRSRWEGSALIPFLTEVFDTPTVYEIPFRKNPVKLIEPTVSLVACTTPDWFWRGMREIDIYGGFGNRFLMLTGEPKPPVAMPTKPDARQLETVRRALEVLDSVSSCEVSLAPNAAKLWQDFYTTWRAESFDPLTKAATKRIPSYILKLTVTYAAFEATVPVITVDQLAAAIAVGHYASKCAALLMTQHQAQSEEGRVEEAIRQRLRERSLTKRSLKNALGGRVRATLFNRVIEAMIRSGEVVSKQGPRFGQVTVSLAGRCK